MTDEFRYVEKFLKSFVWEEKNMLRIVNLTILKNAD